MQVIFLEEAKLELTEAVNYYNDQNNGLGYEFAAEVKKTIERITQYPEAWFSISKRTKRCRCNRFPYGIIYYIDNDKIVIVAVMHLKRKPNYWKNRI